MDSIESCRFQLEHQWPHISSLSAIGTRASIGSWCFRGDRAVHCFLLSVEVIAQCGRPTQSVADESFFIIAAAAVTLNHIV